MPHEAPIPMLTLLIPTDYLERILNVAKSLTKMSDEFDNAGITFQAITSLELKYTTPAGNNLAVVIDMRTNLTAGHNPHLDLEAALEQGLERLTQLANMPHFTPNPDEPARPYPLRQRPLSAIEKRLGIDPHRPPANPPRQRSLDDPYRGMS